MLAVDIRHTIGAPAHTPHAACDGVYEVGKFSIRRGDHMDNPRGRCVSGLAATLGERVASLLEELRG
jgi:hypothetical protein